MAPGGVEAPGTGSIGDGLVDASQKGARPSMLQPAPLDRANKTQSETILLSAE